MSSVGLPPPPREASKPPSQPAATATGQRLVGGGDVGGCEAGGPKETNRQVAGPTRHIHILNQPGIVDLDLRS